MEYIIRNLNQKVKAHIWFSDKNDTACKMWSTGGLSKKKGYVVTKHSHAKEICMMCKNNYEKLTITGE